jgi:prepilin-type processing-associated H-X9-DG protein
LVIAGTDPTGYGNHHLFDVMPSPRYVKLNNTGPERKTTKMLGDRSIVADRFGKRSEYDSSFSESTPWDVEAAYDRKYPGDGAYAHKEGYNVLYGDGHCGWYGDPQGQIIWMGFPQQAHNNGWGPGNQTVGIGWCYECAPGIGFFNWFDKPIDSATVWNDWARADQ